MYIMYIIPSPITLPITCIIIPLIALISVGQSAMSLNVKDSLHIINLYLLIDSVKGKKNSILPLPIYLF